MRAPRLHGFQVPAVAVCVFLFLACLFPGLPGLHADEAWVVLEARRIADGARPLDGMNAYTGALYPHLVRAALAFGFNAVATLRGLSALLNALALVVILRLAARLGIKGGVRLGLGLALATAPFFVGLARFAVEINALNPLLLAAGVLGLTEAITASPAAPRRAALGGLCFGLAVYNHAQAAVFVAALAVAALLVHRAALRAHAVTVAALAAGMFVGLMPRLVALVLAGAATHPGTSAGRWDGVGADLLALPGVLAASLDGGLVYRRFVGESWIPVLPYASVGFVVLALVRARARQEAPFTAHERLLAWMAVVGPLLLVAAAPRLSLTYLGPVLIGALLLAFAWIARLEEARPALARRLHGAMAGLVALNVAYLAANYYARAWQTGGVSSRFAVGGRVLETSDHFLRTDRLYDRLAARGVLLVCVDTFIVEPFRVYDLERGAFRLTARCHPNLPLPEEIGRSRAPAALVFYKDQFPPRTWKRLWATLAASGRRFAFAHDVDPHFQVLITVD